MSSETLHEKADKIGSEAVDLHRAITSLMEEFEAVDWYNQRAKATDDPELRKILEHNRDEEKEHAVMALEWLRRHDSKLNEHMRTYLFKEEPVTEIEKEATGHGGDGESAAAPSEGSLGIGSLRKSGGQDQ